MVLTPMRLLTMPISHYCEKVRWALDRQALPYREEGHAPLFHILAALPLTGFRSRTVGLAACRCAARGVANIAADDADGAGDADGADGVRSEAAN